MVIDGDLLTAGGPFMRYSLILSLLLLALAAPAAQAANGDLLRKFDAANPNNCGTNVGLAFDGNDVLVSCVDGASGATKIDYVSTLDGSLVKDVTVSGHNGIAAMAYDAARGKIWACDAPSGNSPGSGVDVYLIDPNTGASTKQFTVADSCWDGLAYDSSDDTLWVSADQSDNVYHYKTDGTLIQQFTGVSAKLGGSGNSGIAVGGSSLYLSNADGNQIYTLPKDFSSSSLFATEPLHLEDMECDDQTFAPKAAMWVISAFSRELDAFEIPSGSCKFGGGGPPKPLPAPVEGQSVNAVAEAGTVLVKLTGAAKGMAGAAAGGFMPLGKLGRQVPVGSTLDTTKGTVHLLAATSTTGVTQDGHFSKGIFIVQQARTNPLTTATMTGGSLSSCGTKVPSRGAPRVGASARRSRSLFSNVRGRFRVRGRNSSATVRGTQFLVKDTCAGTLTT